TSDRAEITQGDDPQAIEIVRQRVDGAGVSEADITAEGGQDIVVAVPGEPSRETLAPVRPRAQMRLRAFLFQGEAGPIGPQALAEFEEQQEEAGEDPEAEQDPEGQAEELQEAEADGEDAPAEVTAEEIEDAARRAADLDGDGEISDEPESEPANGSDQAWITEQVWYDFYTLDCTDSANLIGGGGDDPDAPLVACDKD